MRETARAMIPESVRRLPADLAATIALALLTILVVALPVIRESPVRVIIGLVFVLFLPGYALIALLFPEAGTAPGIGTTTDQSDADTDNNDDADDTPNWGWSSHVDPVPDEHKSENTGPTHVEDDHLGDRGIDGIERVALSFGLSIAVVPLIGLALNFTPWGIRLVPILVSVSGFTILCAVAAAYRRWELPPEERFAVPYRDWLETARTEVFEPNDRTDAALNIALACSILLAFGAVGYAIVVPPQGEQFTEFYLLTEDDNGDLVAAGYPTELSVGEPADLVVGVENNEHRTVEYTVVIELQAVSTETNETVIEERTELDRFETTLDHDEVWQHSHDVRPTFAGENLRLQYLLYEGEPPAEPTTENAYRDLHLWIDVED